MKTVFYSILILIFINQCENLALHMKLPEINDTNINITSHLHLSHIRKICDSHRDSICKSNNTKVCGLRKINKTLEYKDFENSCYLFLSNMCDYPGDEFAIIEDVSCLKHLKARRHYVNSGVDPGTDRALTNETSEDGNRTKPNLRQFSFSTLYDIDTAYDGHMCPYSCPNVYAPVCINANRGYGKYLKFFQFINHCESDKYYCSHWEEFSPPPDRDEEMVSASPLGWSYCGASRYLQFSLLSQTTSSMGHYGWLEGDYRFSKILEPHQRKPGYG